MYLHSNTLCGILSNRAECFLWVFAAVERGNIGMFRLKAIAASVLRERVSSGSRGCTDQLPSAVAALTALWSRQLFLVWKSNF